MSCLVRDLEATHAYLQVAKLGADCQRPHSVSFIAKLQAAAPLDLATARGLMELVQQGPWDEALRAEIHKAVNAAATAPAKVGSSTKTQIMEAPENYMPQKLWDTLRDQDEGVRVEIVVFSVLFR